MDSRPYGPYTPPRPRKKYNPLPSTFTDAEIKELEKKNFENNCYFFRSELKQLIKGEFSHDLLTSRERTLLKKRGILLRRMNIRSGDHWTVSDLAKETLTNL